MLAASPRRSAAVGLLATAATVVYAWRLGLSYPLRDWLFWRVALLWAYNLVLFTAVVSAGHLVLAKALRLRLPALEMLAQSIPVGLVVFCLLMYALGALGLYRTPVAIGLVVLLIGMGALPLYRFAREGLRTWREDTEPPSLNPLVLLVLAFGVGCLGFVYLPLLTPTAVNFDATWYHLTVAQDFAREGRIIPFEADYPRNWPNLAPIVHTWGWLLPVPGTLERWTLPLHTEFFVFLSTLLGTSVVVRHLIQPTRVRFAWAGFFLFPSIFIYDSNIGGGAEHFLALFAPALLMSAFRASEQLDSRQLALFGVLTGGAILTRYQGAYLVGACGSLILVAWISQARDYMRRRLRGQRDTKSAMGPLLVGPSIAVGVAAAVVAPHFLKNWIFYDNPFYPFFQATLGGTPTIPDAALEVEGILKGPYLFRPPPELSRRLQEAVNLLFTFSFKPHYNFAKPWPLFGSLFTLTLPLIPWLRSPGRVAKAAGVAVLGLLCWGMLLRVDRHLQALLPLFVAATTATLIRAWELGWVARCGTACLVSLQLIWTGDALFHEPQARLTSAINLITSGYRGALPERNSYRAAFVAITRATPRDAKVLLRPVQESLGIDRRTLIDQAGHQGLISYAGIGGPTALKRYYERLGITHVVAFPAVDSWDKRAEILTQDLYRSGKAQVFGPLSLFSVAETRPRPDPGEYRVVVSSVPPYADGAYALDDLGTWEPWDYPGRRVSPPRRPLPAAERDRASLLEAASAVLMGPGTKPLPQERAVLARRFVVVRESRAFRLYLLR